MTIEVPASVTCETAADWLAHWDYETPDYPYPEGSFQASIKSMAVEGRIPRVVYLQKEEFEREFGYPFDAEWAKCGGGYQWYGIRVEVPA